MAMQDVPWDEETDSLITSIDAESGGSPTLRDLLLNPQKYMGRPGSSAILDKARTKVSSYFDALLESMQEDQQRFMQELESANSQYIRINQVIGDKALSMNVPFIKPSFVDVDKTVREDISVQQYSSQIEQLIGKLISASKYVADISTQYKNYSFGSWLFSADRVYVMTLEQPKSPVMYLENSRAVINETLDDIAAQYGSRS